ncbi:MAG: porin [Candidatus Electrothrix sp. YB6]
MLTAASGEAQLLDKVSVHGFGGWVYGKTDNENEFYGDKYYGDWDTDETVENFNFFLNIRTEITEDLTVYLQPGFISTDEERETKIDYAFVEWYLSDLVTYRAGKIRVPFMLFNEIYGVGTVRPFLFLPQGIYNPRIQIPEYYQGAGMRGDFFDNYSCCCNWQLSYDIFGGSTFLYESNDVYNVTDIERYSIKGMLGGRLVLHPPVDRLQLSLSSYTGEQEARRNDGGVITEFEFGTALFIGGSIEYLNDKWNLRSEYMVAERDENQIGGVGDAEYTSWYAEAAYRLTEHWQLAARYEEIENPDNNPYPCEDKRLSSDHTLKKSTEWTIGLNYWVSPNLVVKCSTTFIRDNENARPTSWINIRNPQEYPFEEETVLTLIGVQFSF